MANKKGDVGREEPVHMLFAIRRCKDNPGQTHKDELCVREIEDRRSSWGSLASKLERGYWRVYRTVNRRDTRKATRLLQHRLLDEFDEWHYRVDSLYKTCLMQPTCRAEKNFLIDVDTKDPEVVEGVRGLLDSRTKILDFVETPKGYHFVTEPFNYTEFGFGDYVEVKNDGLVFVTQVRVGR